MVAIPLGRGAYSRSTYGELEVRLENRFFEQNPTNLVDGAALVARSGSVPLSSFDGGSLRGTFAKKGLMGGDLFVVSGANLWRYASDGTKTQITGIVNGTGHPSLAWQKGIGFERLFIADGLRLQYYEGGTKATDVLTLAGGAITDQIIEIGGVYYSWNTDVTSNTEDGTSANPWLANPGTDPLVAMANLLNFNGVPGVDFSQNLTGPSAFVTAESTDPSATGTLTLSGGAITNQVFQFGDGYYSWNANVDANAPDGSATHPWLAKLGATDADSLATMAKLINFTGTSGTDYSTVLAAASVYGTAVADTTTLVLTASTPGSSGNATATTVYSGSFLAWGAATLTGGADTASTLTATSKSVYAAGNAVTASVFSGSFLTWATATLTGGNVHALVNVPTPDGVAIRALASVSGFVLASVSSSQECFFIMPGATTIDPLNFFEKESNPDNILDMLTIGDQVLITGDGSAENWYATGQPLAPFAPQEGRVYQRGVVEGTPVVAKDAVIFVGDDGVVYSVGYAYGDTAQWGVHRISNHGIEERIRRCLRAEQGLDP